MAGKPENPTHLPRVMARRARNEAQPMNLLRNAAYTAAAIVVAIAALAAIFVICAFGAYL